MKTNRGIDCSKWFAVAFTRALVVAGLLFGLSSACQASLDPGGGFGGPTNEPLNSWSFWSYRDNTNWNSDFGYAPVSFTNLNYSYLGNGSSLVMDTNVPAWLQYNVFEADGNTNLTLDSGSVTLWYAPNWSSVGDTNGGFGPGEYGRLLEVGSYTDDSSYGWWSLFVDNGGTNLYFAAQTNDLSSSMTVYLSAPIDWTTNFFHFISVTYSPTNTTLYLDGEFVTNGPGMTIYPGPEVLTNGFYLGSSAGGTNQAHGLFNTVQTYNYPLSSDDVQSIFNAYYIWYMMSPWNTAMFIASAPSTPSPLTSAYNIITGSGSLQSVGTVTAITSTNFWITNVTATATSGGMSMTFTIQGGYDGAAYDVFANSILDFSSDTNKAWGWMGQGYHGNIYTLTNLPLGACFLMLGSPTDSDFDGLTDAYERLVSKTDPNNADTDGDGISDSDEILFGNDPLTSGPGWKLDTDSDGLPDNYESFVGWNPNSAEAAPSLPTYSANPVQ
jgi:hypothetical protein